MARFIVVTVLVIISIILVAWLIYDLNRNRQISRQDVLAALAALASTIGWIVTIQLPISSDTVTHETIETIHFDYPNSPFENGWKLAYGNENNVIFTHLSDPNVGQAMSFAYQTDVITDVYGIDYMVGTLASQFGTDLRVIAQLERDSLIYAGVTLIDDNGTYKDVWLQFTLTREGPSEQDPNEWFVIIEPSTSESPGGDWLQYQVNLEDAVASTFGTDGWRYHRLRSIRLRGNIAIKEIEISGPIPTN